MQMQAKSMREVWPTNQGGGCRMKLAGAKMRPSYGEELNTIFASAMAKAMKITNKSK